MELHWGHEFACSVASLLVAWDKFRMEEPLDDQLFVVALLQIVRILGLSEALPYLLRNKRWEEHCREWEFAAAAVALAVDLIGLVVADGTVAAAAVAHLIVLATNHLLLEVGVRNLHRWRC